MIKFISSFFLFFFILEKSIAASKILSIDTVICKGNSIKLSSPRAAAVKYIWSTGAITESIEVSPAQTTQYIVESFTPSQVYSDTFSVIIDVPLLAPQISFLNNHLISSYDPSMKIRWVKNNLILPSHNNDTLKFPSQGVYRSEISQLGGCWSPSQLMYIHQDLDTAAIKYTALVFPNPNTGYFNVLLAVTKKVSRKVEIVVNDIEGTELFKTKQFIFNNATAKIPITLPAGYRGQCILSINFNGIIKSQQVIIR